MKIVTHVVESPASDEQLEHVMWTCFGGRHVFKVDAKEPKATRVCLSEAHDDATLDDAAKALVAVCGAKSATCVKL